MPVWVNVQGSGQGQWSAYLTSEEMVVKEVEHLPFEICVYAKPSMGAGKDTLVGKAVVQQQALKDLFATANESMDVKGQLMTAPSSSAGAGGAAGAGAGGKSTAAAASVGVAAGKFVVNMKFVTPDREGEIHTVAVTMDEDAMSKKEV